MFENNPSFQSDISPWNPAAAQNMERMFYNATAFGKEHPLKQTVSEYHSNGNAQFKLFCLHLPNAQVKTLDAFCGSNVRFDPCCATTRQFETSCCNRFCYNTTTTCQYPDHDLGAANEHHFSISTPNLIHDDDSYGKKEEGTTEMILEHSNMRGKYQQGETEKTTLGWEGIVMIAFLLLLVLCCFWAMVKFM